MSALLKQLGKANSSFAATRVLLVPVAQAVEAVMREALRDAFTADVAAAYKWVSGEVCAQLVHALDEEDAWLMRQVKLRQELARRLRQGRR